jgi:hypothetical protein
MRSAVLPCWRVIASQRLQVAYGPAIQRVMLLAELRHLELAQPLPKGHPYRARIETPSLRVGEDRDLLIVRVLVLLLRFLKASEQLADQGRVDGAVPPRRRTLPRPSTSPVENSYASSRNLINRARLPRPKELHVKNHVLEQCSTKYCLDVFPPILTLNASRPPFTL